MTKLCCSKQSAMNVRKSIYVVDDEVAIASTLAAILVESGYSAKYFTSPFEVLDVARSEPPQVLISDYSMPGLTGLELAQDLALLCPQCSVILLSALDLSFIQTQIDKFPMPIPRFTFFRKPVAVRTLLDAIRQVLEESVV
jgi:FixJ family two-component response regulator